MESIYFTYTCTHRDLGNNPSLFIESGNTKEQQQIYKIKYNETDLAGISSR